MADVRFVVQGQEILAHRAILVAGCSFFKNMFTSKREREIGVMIYEKNIGGMMESQASVIEVNDVKIAAFNGILQEL